MVNNMFCMLVIRSTSMAPGAMHYLASSKFYLNRDHSYTQNKWPNGLTHLSTKFLIRLLWGFFWFSLLLTRQPGCPYASCLTVSFCLLVQAKQLLPIDNLTSASISYLNSLACLWVFSLFLQIFHFLASLLMFFMAAFYSHNTAWFLIITIGICLMAS